jgi:hypothetical protein
MVGQYWTHGKKKRGGKTRQLNPQGKLLWLHRTDLKSPTGSGPRFVLVHPKYGDGCVLNGSLVLLFRTQLLVPTLKLFRAAMKIIL